MRIQVPQSGFNGVPAAGVAGTATIKLPVGRRYHELLLGYTDAVLADLTEIRVIANNEVIHRYSGAERDSMNQFDQRAAAAGVLTLPFDRTYLTDRLNEIATALNTGSVDPKTGAVISALTLEVDIAATHTGVVFTLDSTQSEGLEGGPGLVLRTHRATRAAAGAGLKDHIDLPFGTPSTLSLNRTFIKTGATALRVHRNNYDIFKRTKAVNDKVQTDGVRAPQAGYFVFDTTEWGYGNEVVDLVGYTDFGYELTHAGAETAVFLSEYLGAFTN